MVVDSRSKAKRVAKARNTGLLLIMLSAHFVCETVRFVNVKLVVNYVFQAI